MKKIALLAAAALVLIPLQAKEPLYKDSKASVEKRVEDLLKRMTLEEKLWQLTQGVIGQNDNPKNISKEKRNVNPMIGSVISRADDSNQFNAFQQSVVENSRLGIPVLFGYDVIHGFRTIFPIPLAQGASFNPDLAYKACRVAAAEAWAAGLDWTFSPMIDITHDPRWGRVMESYGEDPHVNSVFCVSAVKGYQGDDLSKPGNIAACLKHFVGYGVSDGGRDYYPTDISNQALWDTYFPPYEAGVKAGAATIMSAFNTLNGVPATGNPYTLQTVLRDTWGFKGFVVADWQAVQQTVLQNYAEDDKDAALKCLSAGVDMDMNDYVYLDQVKALVDEGKLSMKVIDQSVRRILSLKFRLGLFDNMQRPETKNTDFLKPEYLELAENFAAETMVLLKNDGVLPLKKEVKVAVVGPIAEDRITLLGNWKGRGRAEDVVSTLYGAIRKEFSNVTYACGCDVEGKDASRLDEAVKLAYSSDVVVLCIGEGEKWTGEDCSRGTISLPVMQENLLHRLAATGKPVVVVLESGRPMDLSRILPDAAALIDIWNPGTAGAPALAGVLSGRHNPSGKLPITFPATQNQIPVFYNHRDRSRRGEMGLYKDGTPVEPLFEFGYGLSYSSFKYSDLKVDGLKATVKVTNTSKVDGKETVLWFIQDPVCSIVRPVKELKHFEKRLIKAGETQEFLFNMDELKDLGFVNAEGKRFFEKGRFVLMVGDKKAEFVR